MFKFAPALLTALLLPAAMADTIYEIVANSPDHTILARAINFTFTTMDSDGAGTTGLAAVIGDLLNTTDGDDAGLTLFAPTDAAFGEIDPKWLQGQWGFHLINILSYHISPGKTMSTDLEQDMMVITENYEVANITSLDPPMINDATITAADLEADNGVVHVIDKVLLPRFVGVDIMHLLYQEDLFFTFTQMLDNTGVADALNTTGPFTVFAPVEDAFAVLSDDKVTSLTTTEEGMAELKNILEYHIMNGSMPAENLFNTAIIIAEMLNGDNAEFTNSSDLYGMNSTTTETKQMGDDEDDEDFLGLLLQELNMWVSNVTDVVVGLIDEMTDTEPMNINGEGIVVFTNILANNGIIHVIDSIMFPPNPPSSSMINDTDCTEFPNSTMLMCDEDTAVAAAEAEDIDGGMA